MKFDFAIGNPPYQEETENNGRQSPVYNKFMEEAYKIANCVELITPARFLFNAGQTPKAWNEKMLNDEHFKVLKYEPDASKVFQNTEIKGGVAITIRDDIKNYGSIKVFTSREELNGIVKRVSQIADGGKYLDTIISSRGCYRTTELFF
jgi:type II restriction enzyme